MKRYFNTDTDEMEMPCLCGCGTWFDLTDGYGSNSSDTVICPACHDREEEIEDLEGQIEDLELQEGAHKREINKLKKKLQELTGIL